ncbi:MAG TPA: hypothetical protein VIC71_04885 [Gammaproteobacteria bacterium]|jgi:hypothetical protein
MTTRRLPSVYVTALAAAGFAVSAHAQVRTFANPAHDGLPLSYCVAGGEVCGAKAATDWCQTQGFDYATDWSAAPGVDVTSTTVRLDDGGICRGAQCEAFATITCADDAQALRMATLGPWAHTRVLEPGMRAVATPTEPTEYQVLIPGCHQREPGVFLCESVHEYQHCRTLMGAAKIFGCRAGLAFDGGFAEPVAPEPDDYELDVRSNAEMVVTHGQRGEAKVRGDARVKVAFAMPAVGEGAWCLQRERYVYYPTGPKGGLSEIDDAADCDAPIEATVVPNEDDALQAYDMCDVFAAWGGEIEQPIELLVAGLFHVSSASPTFTKDAAAGTRIIAPYLTVRAPMKVSCED